MVKNDHKPLLKIFNPTLNIPVNYSARLQRWTLRLSQFRFKVTYIKGNQNQILDSDFLSRLPLPDTVNEVEPYDLIFVVDSLNGMPITFQDISVHTASDKNLKILMNYIKIGFPTHLNYENLSKFKNLQGELSILQGCIMYNNRVYIAESLRENILLQFHTGHPGISAMKAVARSLIWYPGLDHDIIRLVKSCLLCSSVLAKPPQKYNIE